MRKSGLSDHALIAAVSEMESGLIDADLGGHLVKKRVALPSQAVFAAILNTSVSSVQKWEIGDKKPSGPSLKLLSLIQRKGLDAVL